MNGKKRTDRKKNSEEQPLETEAQKHAARSRSLLYNQIDSHKWANKMEIFRILAS